MLRPLCFSVAAVFAGQPSGLESRLKISARRVDIVLDFLGESGEGFDRKQVYRGAQSYLPKTGPPKSNPAVKDMIRCELEDRDDPLIIVALAPNVVAALLLEPKLIDGVTMMWLGTQQYYSRRAGDYSTNRTCAPRN